MGDQSTDFVTRFHSLEGDTISDRKKNFNKLIRDPSFSANKQQIHGALDKLEPKTYLESLFKVDALIYFRHTNQLVEILKQGNEVFISKILKQQWFFEDVFQNVDAHTLVNDFLPCLSFTIRMKVLKRLSMVLDEQKMDAIYDCLHQRYGRWIAVKFLHSCTKEKLKSVLDNEEITLRAHQVLLLFNKNSELFEMYIDYYKKTFEKTYSEAKITDQIAKKNPELFLQLKKQERINVSRLGRRTSKKFFELVKDDVSKDFDHYQCLLNKPVLIKKMGDEFKQVYLQKFPKKLKNIGRYSDCRTLLRYYPKNKRWELFRNTFEQKFPDKSLNQLFLTLGTDIENLYPNRQVIFSWSEVNYQKNNDESFLKYFPSSRAIQMIKEKINVTSDIYKRGSLVNLLVQTCKESQDLKALEEVLKYVCFRHRNEDINFKHSFLCAIKSNFELQDLNKTHWEHIGEIIKILEIQKQFPFWKFSNFLFRRLEFLVKSGEDYKEYLVEFVRVAVNEGKCFRLSLDNPEIERKLLVEMIGVLPEAMANLKAEDSFECHVAFMCDIMAFSEKYPDHFVDLGQYDLFGNIFNDLMQNFEDDSEKKVQTRKLIVKVLEFKNKFPQCTLCVTYDQNLVDMIRRLIKFDVFGYGTFNKCIKMFLQKKPRNDFENLLLDSYFQDLYIGFGETGMVNWYLKNDPRALKPYLSNKNLEYLHANLDLVKLYSHFNFDKIYIAYSLNRFEGDQVDYYVCNAAILHKLLPGGEFAALIEKKLAPTKVKLDLQDAQMKKFYDVQCQIANNLHRIEEPLKLIRVVSKFCVGDYLQSALPSLQGVFYKSPEKELYDLADDLSGKAVSVRKHAVFLSCELLKQDHALEMLSKEDSNMSSQKHLFTAALKYFKKNPSQELLQLVVKNMSTIDKNDTETLESLVNISVPKKYKGFYIEKCWKFYESMKSSGVNVGTYLENLLRTVLKHVDILVALPPSFIENIIENYFCSTLLSFEPVVSVLCTYSIHAEHSRLKYLDNMFKKLSKAKTKEVKSFVDCLITLDLTRDFMLTLLGRWNDYFNVLETFEEHVMLNLLSFDVTIEYFAQNIITYNEQLIENYGTYAFDLFKQVFKRFTDLKETKKQFELLTDMMTFKTSPLVCILVLSVIPAIDDDESEFYETYNRIMDKIKSMQDPIVKIYCKKFLTDNNLE